MSLFDPTLGALQRALDLRLERHGLLAGNVANADTPGFVPRDLDFAAAMRERLTMPDDPGIPLPRAGMTFASAASTVSASPFETPAVRPPQGERMTGLPQGELIPLDARPVALLPPLPPLTTAPGTGAGLDGNAVDLDRALASLAENAIQYGAAARAAQKKLAILRYAASDGAA